ncbi:MAG: universal stress protein [Rhodothermales bacterium]
MLQVRTILFPTDYSACAEAALTHAGRFANALGAQLHIVHVHETPEAHEEDFVLLETASGTPLDGVGTIEMTVRWPSAKEAILRYAKVHDIDLIVMGTHGRHGLNVLMGSVAETVARHAPCPVLTVRPTAKARLHRTVHRILAPVDLSARSRVGLKYAFSIARLFEAQVKVVHIVDHLPVPAGEVFDVPPMYPAYILDSVRQVARTMVEDVAQGYPAEIDLVIGHVPTELLAHADAYEADLVVMSSHGRTGLPRFLLGSVAEKLMRHTACPVFTVKSFGKDLLAGPVRSEGSVDERHVLEGCMAG